VERLPTPRPVWIIARECRLRPRPLSLGRIKALITRRSRVRICSMRRPRLIWSRQRRLFLLLLRKPSPLQLVHLFHLAQSRNHNQRSNKDDKRRIARLTKGKLSERRKSRKSLTSVRVHESRHPLIQVVERVLQAKRRKARRREGRRLRMPLA